jgi:hypothetical protein
VGERYNTIKPEKDKKSIKIKANKITDTAISSQLVASAYISHTKIHKNR